ncbi:hypothetical protein MUN81_18090 [Hymenobacter sp. 5317J-9]|uniref:hypothetical protein n=1 Tax=Hymenobacter sp. 5317J-9 TaxID=2932250 RepID=UPI001FD6824E|nr:hypothetical protein [Hymenobacter sp. 5317J-9]UOQ97138.1 hypothetical protein MUN81_18090 [Hymenobacter sp. 5317J-9]
MRDALLFAGKALLGILVGYVLLLVTIRVVAHQMQKATVEERIQTYNGKRIKP